MRILGLFHSKLAAHSGVRRILPEGAKASWAWASFVNRASQQSCERRFTERNLSPKVTKFRSITDAQASDPRALPPNHHSVANIFSSFLPRTPPHTTTTPKTSQQAKEVPGQLLPVSPSLPQSPALHTQLGMQALIQAFLPLCGRAGRLSPGGATLPTDCKGTDETNGGCAPCHDWGATPSLSCCQPAGSKQCHTELSSGQGRAKSLFIELFLLWNFHWPVKYFYIYYTFNGSS